MPRQFLLLGDSHTAAIREAAQALGVGFAGGPIAIGRDLNLDFFDIENDDLRFRDAETDAHYRLALRDIGIESIAALEVPLVSTIGLNIAWVMRPGRWDAYCTGEAAPPKLFLSQAVFEAAVTASIAGSLAFYAYAVARGLRVFAVLPPQLPVKSDKAMFLAGQAVVARRLAECGVELIDLRKQVTDAAGLQRPEFCAENSVGHANAAFGHLVIDRLFEVGAIG
jgi:hypothetical protein